MPPHCGGAAGGGGGTPLSISPRDGGRGRKSPPAMGREAGSLPPLWGERPNCPPSWGFSDCPPIVGGLRGGCGCGRRNPPLNLPPRRGERPEVSPRDGGEAGSLPRDGERGQTAPHRGAFLIAPPLWGGYGGVRVWAAEPPSQSPPATGGEVGSLPPRRGERPEVSPRMGGEGGRVGVMGAAGGGGSGCGFWFAPGFRRFGRGRRRGLRRFGGWGSGGFRNPVISGTRRGDDHTRGSRSAGRRRARWRLAA